MATKEAPEVFGKDDFCLAVSGLTITQLLNSISEEFIEPANNCFGRDMPQTPEDKITGDFLTFMNSNFGVPLLKIPIEKMYEAFSKLREWERCVSPRDVCLSDAQYWEPVYERVEEAYQRGEKQKFEERIQELINQILHY